MGMVFVDGSVNFLGVETFTPRGKKWESFGGEAGIFEVTSPTKYIGVQVVLLY